MLEEVGPENIFIFGLTAEEVAGRLPEYDPWWYYHNHPEPRAALDMLASGRFSAGQPGLFDELRREVLERRDEYMHLADLPAYAAAHAKAEALYRQREEWTRRAVLNVACSGKFSSDRTIAEYAREIWDLKPVRIQRELKRSHTLVEARITPRQRPPV